MAHGTLVDTDVLLDVLTEDRKWLECSANALARAAEGGLLLVNQIVYAEVSIRFGLIEDLEAALPRSDFCRLPLPSEDDAPLGGGEVISGWVRS